MSCVPFVTCLLCDLQGGVVLMNEVQQVHHFAKSDVQIHCEDAFDMPKHAAPDEFGSSCFLALCSITCCAPG